MRNLFAEVGPVHISQKQLGDGEIVLYDSNETWAKIMQKMPQFVMNICGENLEQCVVTFASNMYLSSVKRAIAKVENLQKKNIGKEALEAIKTGELKLKIQKRK